jgi:CRP/FNR family transcriptional regulator, anaerobic regulatory protein
MTFTPANPTPAQDPQTGGTTRNPVAPLPERGHLRDLVRVMGGRPEELGQAEGQLPVTLWRIGENATWLHEGEPAQSVFVLRSGSMKCLKTLEDGYEQVVCFAQSGELLGFEALHSGRHPTSVVALEDATAYALSMSEFRALRQRSAIFDSALQFALSRQLARVAGNAEMMCAVASDVRLTRFLLWMSARMAEAGRSPQRLFLRMCRRDIASLLGMAHETVSRSFTMLSEDGLVKVENREVELLDLERLRVRGRCTRRPVDETARRRPQDANAAVALAALPWPMQAAA